MDTAIEIKFTRFLYFSLSVILILVVLYNISDPWTPAFLSGLLVLSITVRHVLLTPDSEYSRLRLLVFLADLVLIYFIIRSDASGSSRLYYFIVIADAAVSFSYIFSGGIAVLCIFSTLFEGSLTEENLLALVLFYAAMSFVKYEVLQRQVLSRTMYQLKVNEKRLEETYIKLRDASEDMEEMAVLAERNRIAREIHDTVGHTLTTVLVEMEAGERLLSRDPALAAEKLRLAKGQVRKGLCDIRESVGMLNSGREMMGLASSMKLLLDDTAKHGEVYVNYEIGALPTLGAREEKTLYRALQEGLTNGIRHGGSTAFVFKLKYENGSLDFLLEDNGRGCDRIIPGFGLSAMEQRVREAGGRLNMISSAGEGFRISISMPVGGEEPINADKADSGG